MDCPHIADATALESLVHDSAFDFVRLKKEPATFPATMAFPTYLVLAATLCYFVVNAEEEITTSGVDRQSKQMYIVPPQLGYNYYNPYEGQIVMPAEGYYPYQLTGWPYPSGESVYAESEVMDRGSRDSILIISAASECLSANAGTDGLGPCKRTSGAKHGSLSIKLTANSQTAVVGIVRSSRERITLRCSQMTAVSAFTQTGKIADPSVVRSETGVMQLVVSSTGDNAVMKCTW